MFHLDEKWDDINISKEFIIDLLEKITNKKKLMVYKHMGLYNCMDTLHEKKIIQNMISKKSTPPWLK